MKDENVKNITRGGQILIHNLRMTNQILNRVMLLGILIFVLSFIIFALFITTSVERKVTYSLLMAKATFFVRGNIEQEVTINDFNKKMFVQDIIKYKPFLEVLKEFIYKITIVVIISIILSLFSLYFIFLWLRKQGELQSATKELRGESIVDPSRFKKLVKKSSKKSSIFISDIPLPDNFETKHIFIHGTIGTGKSVFIKELLDQIRKRGDKAIIYDKGCDFLRYYYTNEDLILNPLDKRSIAWNFWEEFNDFSDLDSITAALIPSPPYADNPYWITSARAVFSATALKMKEQNEENMDKLLELLLSSDLDKISSFLSGSEAEVLVSPKIEKTAVTVKSVLSAFAKSLKHIDSDGDFSLKKWLCDDSQQNWLFLPSIADKHETLKPLITMWLEICMNALMSLPASNTRRIWFIMDELPTLNKIPFLIPALAESRKFGGCMVVGLQGITQIRDIYGHNAAESIASLCNTKLFFRSPSSETANWVANELGKVELEEVREGISYSESSMRSGISISKHQTSKHIIYPTDIMKLADLNAFMKVVGYPITTLKLKYKQMNEINPYYMPKKISSNMINRKHDFITNKI